jgi:anti-anti-sigma factor
MLMKRTIVPYGSNDNLESATLAALIDGGNVVVCLDQVKSLEIEDIRRLIKLLRQSRNLGTEFALRTSRPDVRRALEVTALDRVFTVVEPDAA